MSTDDPYTTRVLVLKLARLERIFRPPGLPLIRKDPDAPHATTAILVGGQAGTGKTTLLTALAQGPQPLHFETDRREKTLAYRQIPTLKAYILAEQDRRAADYFIRDETGEWQQGTLGEMDILGVDCGTIKIGLALDDIYEDVDFLS